MKRITKIEQLEFDIGYAYSNLDEVFSILQLLESYFINENSEGLNKWTIRKSINGLKSLIIEIQCNLEQAIEDKTEKKEEDDDGRC